MTSTDAAQLDDLYRSFDKEQLSPLWTKLSGLMPTTPEPTAITHVWQLSTLSPLARRAGDLVPVGRGGERRAIALANPGLALSQPGVRASSPFAAYRWEHTDRALREQLSLEDAGAPVTVEPGHAAVRYTNPSDGGDVMPTFRAEFHRLRADSVTTVRREVGSSVWQVFDGTGTGRIDGCRLSACARRLVRRAVLEALVSAR
jgi:gentisate 1,2-dioxygenase